MTILTILSIKPFFFLLGFLVLFLVGWVTYEGLKKLTKNELNLDTKDSGATETEVKNSIPPIPGNSPYIPPTTDKADDVLRPQEVLPPIKPAKQDVLTFPIGKNNYILAIDDYIDKVLDGGKVAGISYIKELSENKHSENQYVKAFQHINKLVGIEWNVNISNYTLRQ